VTNSTVTDSLSSRALPFAVLIFAGIFFWAWVVVAGTGGGLTDPADILTQGAQATSQADSFHVALTVEGTVTDRESGDPVDLSGMSVDGDVDVANKAAHVSFSLPMLFGMEGEVIAVGDDLYLLTPMAGDQWIHLQETSEDTGEDGDEPAEEPTNEDIAAKIDELLATEGVSITMLADQACGDDTCYHLQLSISEEAMAAHGDMGEIDEVGGTEIGGMLPDPEFSGPAVVDLLFQQNGLWLREVSMSSEGDTGEASMRLELSEYNTAFDISAPPADEVIEGEDFPFFQ
jgi:LppX_LprAFG lipoprotein